MHRCLIPLHLLTPKAGNWSSPFSIHGSKWKVFLVFWFSEPSSSPKRSAVILIHSMSPAVDPVTPAAGAKPMRGSHSVILYAGRPWARRTHLSGSGGVHLALFMVLNHSYWSFLHCYSTFHWSSDDSCSTPPRGWEPSEQGCKK